jgi:hypothetical protein
LKPGSRRSRTAFEIEQRARRRLCRRSAGEPPGRAGDWSETHDGCAGAEANYRGSRLVLPKRKSTNPLANSCGPRVRKRDGSRNWVQPFNLALRLENWPTLIAPVSTVLPGRLTSANEIAVIEPPLRFSEALRFSPARWRRNSPHRIHRPTFKMRIGPFLVTRFLSPSILERVLLFNNMA